MQLVWCLRKCGPACRNDRRGALASLPIPNTGDCVIFPFAVSLCASFGGMEQHQTAIGSSKEKSGVGWVVAMPSLKAIQPIGRIELRHHKFLHVGQHFRCKALGDGFIIRESGCAPLIEVAILSSLARDGGGSGRHALGRFRHRHGRVGIMGSSGGCGNRCPWVRSMFGQGRGTNI